MPNKIKLEPSEAKALQNLSVKQQAISEFVQLVTSQGEQRLSSLRNETADVWDKLRKKYDLDLEHVNYTLDNDGEHIIPISQRFV